MSKAMFRDKDKCINCHTCVIACKMEHNYPPHVVFPPIAEPNGISLIEIYQYGPEIREDKVYQYFLPLSCMHCADAPCIKACPRSAIYKDPETGYSFVDGEKCIGCKFCLWVCPYGSPSFNEDGKMELCDMCIHRLREGKKPACEAACVAGAIFTGTTEEIARLQGKKAVERLDRGEITT